MMRGTLFFFALMATLIVNMDDNLVARLGIEASTQTAFIAAALLTPVLALRSTLLAGTAVLLSLMANMPADFAFNPHLNRDYLGALVVAIAAMPVVSRVLD